MLNLYFPVIYRGTEFTDGYFPSVISLLPWASISTILKSLFPCDTYANPNSRLESKSLVTSRATLGATFP